MNIDYVKALLTMFEMQEKVWITNNLFSVARAMTLEDAIKQFGLKGTNGSFLCLNPSKDIFLPRHKSNVQLRRNLLIEFDTVPLQNQKNVMERYKIPYSLVTFSGKKSHHFVLSLEEPVSEEKYIELHFKLCRLTGDLADKANCDSSRWTRLPFGVRTVREKDITQKVMFIGNRIANERLEKLLNTNELDTAWRNSAKFKSMNRVTNVDSDREYAATALKWYVEKHLGRTFGTGHYACPLCVEEGHDADGNNLFITAENALANCFHSNGLEHNAKLIKHIIELQCENDAQVNTVSSAEIGIEL